MLDLEYNGELLCQSRYVISSLGVLLHLDWLIFLKLSFLNIYNFGNVRIMFHYMLCYCIFCEIFDFKFNVCIDI